MNRRISIALLAFSCLGLATPLAMAQDSNDTQTKSKASESKEKLLNLFEKHVLEQDGKTLNYRLMKAADQSSTDKVPLVIFLHGAGERGDDNEVQLVHGMKDFASDANRSAFPCYVLAPQCPKNQSWASIDRIREKPTLAEDPSEALGLVVDLVAQLQKEFPIDSQRIYITGLSMGGYGTWDAIQRHPEMFAAALPICGGGDSSAEKVAPICQLPIWVFHGGADNVVPAERSRELIAALKDAGGEPKYTQYQGVGHDSWTATYSNPEVMKWLFSQKKKVSN